MVLKTAPAKETKAMLEVDYLAGQDVAYIPQELRHYRKGKNRDRKTKLIPICPRVLFVPTFIQDHLPDIKHITGLIRARDEQGRPWTISEASLIKFKEMVCSWHLSAIKAHEQKPKGKRPRLHGFAELKTFFDTLSREEMAS